MEQHQDALNTATMHTPVQKKTQENKDGNHVYLNQALQTWLCIQYDQGCPNWSLNSR